MSRLENGVWPLRVDDRAPWRQPWPDDDLGYADHLTSPVVDSMPREVYEPAARALQEHLDAVERGAAFDRDCLHRLAEAAAVPLRDSRDRRPVVVGTEPVPESVVALQALDRVPDAGQRSAHEILGPWRLALSPTHDRTRFVFALAQWAMSGPGRSPIEVWTRSRGAPPAAMRASLRAIWQAPLGVWRLVRAGDAWTLEDRLGLHPRRVPAGPVPLSLDAPPVEGASVLGRVVRTQQGWHLWGGLVLAREPSDAVLDEVMSLGIVRERLRNRRASLEDVLRGGARWFACRVLIATFRE